jgi:hypothetical protein
MYKLKNMYRIIFMNFFQNGYGNEVQTRIKKKPVTVYRNQLLLFSICQILTVNFHFRPQSHCYCWRQK